MFNGTKEGGREKKRMDGPDLIGHRQLLLPAKESLDLGNLFLGWPLDGPWMNGWMERGRVLGSSASMVGSMVGRLGKKNE